jgi:hypothetical protein
MSNTIKSLIQQNKNELNIPSSLSKSESNNEPLVSTSKSNRSGSVSSNRKKSETSSPTHRISPSSSPKASTGLYKLSENETKTSLNEIYISPSGEIRNAAKRASIKLQQNVLLQQKQYIELLQNNNETPPAVPTSPLPESSIDSMIDQVNLNGKF